MPADSGPLPRDPAARAWRAAGVLITVVAVAAGALATGSWLAGSGPVTVERSERVDPGPVSRVELDLDAGDVTVTAAGAAEAVVEQRLEWHRFRPTVTEQRVGDTLRLSASCPRQRSCSVDVTLRLPEQAALRAATAAGDVSVTGLAGELDLTATAGEITLSDVSGPVRVRGQAGDITGVGLHAAEVDVRTRTGIVRLGFVSAPRSTRVRVEVGAAVVVVPPPGAPGDGYRVTADSVAGQRTVNLPEDPAGERSILVEVMDGDVTVRAGPG